MPEYTINPVNLGDAPSSTEQGKMLAQFITTFKYPFIARGRYRIAYDNNFITLKLTHDLLIRPRAHDETQTRIEILNALPLNQGGYGRIYVSLGVLIPEKGYTFKQKPFEQSRVCKIIPYEYFFQKTSITREADYTTMNSALHCKKAIFSNGNGFITMRHIRRCDLFDLAGKLELGEVVLSIEKRLQLTYNIMQAIQQQAHQSGLIHNDIKPENLIIDWENLAVTLIDYYFAQPIKPAINTGETFGTTAYIAPEIFKTGQRSIQSDLFSLGLTLAYLWGDASPYTAKTEDIADNPQYYYQNRTWQGLFKGLKLPSAIKQKITMHFDLLTDLNPNNRISLDKAMEYWMLIEEEYKHHQTAHAQSITAAHNELGLFKVLRKYSAQQTSTDLNTEPQQEGNGNVSC